MSHHKAGTVLLRDILRDAASLVGAPFVIVRYADRCRPGTWMMYPEVNRARYEELISHCPGVRGVHMVRQPSTMLVSDYVYLQKLSPHVGNRENPLRNRVGAELRRSPSVEWGLRKLCRVNLERIRFVQDMLAIHDLVKANPNMLEVRHEGMEAGFDNQTRRMFQHLLGSASPHIGELVSRARAHDLSRLDPARKRGMYREHVSDPAKKEGAFVVLRGLLKEENRSSCFGRLAHFDAALGYGPQLP